MHFAELPPPRIAPTDPVNTYGDTEFSDPPTRRPPWRQLRLEEQRFVRESCDPDGALFAHGDAVGETVVPEVADEHHRRGEACDEAQLDLSDRMTAFSPTAP
ncbi:hypothetical protein [Nocardia sp. NPDC057227]|uniref:hypothetical protein n=1 Tax=Nocardia sp. NPDC057227 TaxID=3346056 RepID=UPI00363CE51F